MFPPTTSMYRVDWPALRSRSGSNLTSLAPYLLLVPLAGCGDSETILLPNLGPEGWDPIVDPASWEFTTPSEDPLADHREEDQIVCDEEALRQESGIEISTMECNYASLTQESQLALSKGDNLRVVAWWGRLRSDTAAEAHLALVLGGDVVWEEFVGIPGESGIVDLEFDAPKNYDQGTPVVLHLHNHGTNTWQLGLFSVAKQ